LMNGSKVDSKAKIGVLSKSLILIFQQSKAAEASELLIELRTLLYATIQQEKKGSQEYDEYEPYGYFQYHLPNYLRENGDPYSFVLDLLSQSRLKRKQGDRIDFCDLLVRSLGNLDTVDNEDNVDDVDDEDEEKGNINKNDELTQRRNGIQENKILAEHKEKAIKIALSGNLTPRAVYSLKQIYDLEIQTELLINYGRELLKKKYYRSNRFYFKIFTTKIFLTRRSYLTIDKISSLRCRNYLCGKIS